MTEAKGSLKGKRVFVTGGDGFIGSHLVELLVEEGAEVCALAQYNSFGSAGWLDQLPVHVRQSIEIRLGDIRDDGLMLELISGSDIVFHLAALIGIPYSYIAPASYVDVNVKGSLNVFEACRRHSVSRIVHTSTSEVYGTAQFTPITEGHPNQGQSPYSASKIAADAMAEAYARSFELPIVILRPFNTYGPRQSERAVIPTIIRQAIDPECRSVRLGDLTTGRDFTYVKDTANAFALAGITAGLAFGTPYNAGSQASIRIGELTELLLKLTGSNKKIETDQARVRPSDSEVRLLHADSTKFEAASGWRPDTKIEPGLEATVEWWRRRISAGESRQANGYAI